MIVAADAHALVIHPFQDGNGRLSRIPLDFIGEPEDQVGAVMFLVSDAARYVTGTAIVVDGGAMLMGPPSRPSPVSR